MTQSKKVSPKKIAAMMQRRFDSNKVPRRPLVIRNSNDEVDGFCMMEKIIIDKINNLVGIFYGAKSCHQVSILYEPKSGKILINSKLYSSDDESSKISGMAASVLAIFM